ncbi:hypothetical protein RHO15_09540 [Utexia brackfieldae]|uniref:hypothetical protein n=1 Tax=Utexia brackfieldae TaxID=3074108 RepID=UPI00370D8877
MRYTEKRLYIPPRDKHIEVKAKPAIGHDCCHDDQVKNGFILGFARYKKAMMDLSKY